MLIQQHAGIVWQLLLQQHVDRGLVTVKTATHVGRFTTGYIQQHTGVGWQLVMQQHAEVVW